MKRSSVMMLFTLLGCVGCSSTRSTILNRNEADGFTRNTVKPEHGFPITVKVPTHVNVWIEEEYYLTKRNAANSADTGSSDGGDEADAVPAAGEAASGANNEQIVPVSLGKSGDRIITILTSYEYTDKLFTVDLKRPAVGELHTDVSIDPRDQYFNHIHGKVVDNTIREITDIVNQFAPAIGLKASMGDDVKLITAKRTLAYGRFDIDSPTFEAELNGFLDYHINSCNTCAKWECNHATEDKPATMTPEVMRLPPATPTLAPPAARANGRRAK